MFWRTFSLLKMTLRLPRSPRPGDCVITFFVMRYVTAVYSAFRVRPCKSRSGYGEAKNKLQTHLLDTRTRTQSAAQNLHSLLCIYFFSEFLIVFLSQVPRRATFSRPPTEPRLRLLPTISSRLYKTKPKQRTPISVSESPREFHNPRRRRAMFFADFHEMQTKKAAVKKYFLNYKNSLEFLHF